MGFDPKNIAVIGASGAIGGAFVAGLSEKYPHAQLHAFSRDGTNPIDYGCEDSISQAAELAAQGKPLDLVIFAGGILHGEGFMPEKSLKDLSAEKFHKVFEANTVTPALLAKFFLPKLNKENTSVFAALSARVGSVSDNRLGGWYAYRSSKAALNMVIKTAAIEMGRRNKRAIVVGLHPGTVDSNLSKPFQANVPDGGLFTPQYSADRMIHVIEHLKHEQTGKCYAFDGEEVLP